MFQNSQNWDLFGYDVRQVGKYWRSAWRDFLWAYDSPVKAYLDEVVKVRGHNSEGYFHSGLPVEPAAAECEAIFLPESLVLEKVVVMPLAVERDLADAMAMEVIANSPFPPGDTGSGWIVIDRDETRLRVQLVIVSLSATMSYLGKEHDCHDVHAYEIWAQTGESPIVLSGFGERKRLQRYNRRVIRVSAIIACSLVLVVTLFGIAAGVKYLELQQVREMSVVIGKNARQASQMRSSLAAANATITAVNALVVEYPNPHHALVKLSGLLSDDVFIVHLSMASNNIKLLGRAKNAAEVMQQLTDEPSYAEVTAPGGITKLSNTGLEQFSLNIRLAGEQP